MKKQYKFLLITIIGLMILMAAIILPWIYGRVQNALQEQKLKEDLSVAIDRHLKGETPYVDIAALTTFEWDRLYIFGPYTSDKALRNTLPSNWDGRYSVEVEEGYTLLVFVQNNQVVLAIEYPNRTSFAYCYRRQGYGNNEAHFIIRHTAYDREFDSGNMEWVYDR